MTDSDVAVVYRHFPLHDFAAPAAVAAECAGRHDRFEALHDALYAWADDIGRAPWLGYALDAGISDTTAFQKCFDEQSHAFLARDSAAAAELNVRGTPTFLINDLMVRGFFGAKTMNAWIADALRQQQR